jgi:hypothetical protein
MVIIEVKREFDGFDGLLGEHRWNEFLKNPSKEEMEKVTQVYYCVYNSGRQVQKNGARSGHPNGERLLAMNPGLSNALDASCDCDEYIVCKYASDRSLSVVRLVFSLLLP